MTHRAILDAGLIVLLFVTVSTAEEVPPTILSASEPSAVELPGPVFDCDRTLRGFVSLKASRPEVDWKGLALFADGPPVEMVPVPDEILCRARAAFLVADLAPVSEKESERYYRLARDLGTETLRGRPERAKQISNYRSVAGRLKEFDEHDANALYWVAVGWGHLLGTMNIFSAAKQAGEVVRTFEWYLKLSPVSVGAGADVFLATYYASLPRLLGQDMKRALNYAELAAGREDMHNCRIQVLLGVIGDRLPDSLAGRLRTRLKQPVDPDGPYGFENTVCQ